jgi:glucose-fructose oxidoreductase
MKRSSLSPLRSELSRREFLGRLSLGAAGLAVASRLRAAEAAVSPGKKLGVALVGLGSYSKGQLGPALKLTQNCYLAGVVTGDRAKGETWAKEFGFPEKNIFSYATMDRLADAKDIDIVYVVTPNGLHAGHVIAAAKAGKHVISEKPLANTVAECDAMLAACRAAKVKFSVGYRLHFDPYHMEMMRLARDRDFGALTKLSGTRSFVLKEGAWRANKKLAGGGPMMDLGIYIIQGACMAAHGFPAPGGGLASAPIAVTAKENPKTKPAQFGEGVEESIDWTMEFANGAILTASTNYVVPGVDRFRAEGAKGFIDFKEHAFTYRGSVVETSRDGRLNFGPFVNQQALQMDDFAQCIREGRESRVPGEMGRRDLVIIEAIYAAARTGQRTLVKV